jgi:hypothetical protein
MPFYEHMKCMECCKMHSLRTDAPLKVGGVVRMKNVCSCVSPDVYQMFERVAFDIPADCGSWWAKKCGTKSWLDNPHARAVLRGEGVDITRKENYHLDPEKRREWTNKEKRPPS